MPTPSPISVATPKIKLLAKQGLDLDALAKQGIPQLQAEAFADIANKQNCIILSRVPGIACFDLLEAGYDAKSFHIKGKSCDWGPMSGFVCLDPLLNKSGTEGAADNAKSHKKSLTDLYAGLSGKDKGNLASYTPSQIEQAHLDNLQTQGLIKVEAEGKDYLLGTAEKGNLKFSIMFKNHGKKQRNNEPGDITLWSLYYCLEEAYGLRSSDKLDLVSAFANNLKGLFSSKKGDDPDYQKDITAGKASYEHVAEKLLKAVEKLGIIVKEKRYVPIFAMTNPNLQYDQGDYRNAITGDYDLFAVWPKGADATDKRVAGMKADTKNNDIVKDEEASSIGKTVGNISERIYTIAQSINSAMGEKYYYGPNGTINPNRVYHSDEGGRPFVKSIDLPVAVFAPAAYGSTGFIVKEVGNLAECIEEYAKQGHTIFINKGWRDILAKYPNIAQALAESEKF